MSKKSRRKVWSRLSLAVTGLAAVGAGGAAAYELRQSNLHMLTLYTSVLDADKSGQYTYEKLAELQKFVAAHMNATPPKLGTNAGIQLKYTYERAKQAEQDRVSAARAQVATDAQNYCLQALPKATVVQKTQCVSEQNALHVITEKQIIPDLYRYDFASPRWSPDAAGILLLIAFSAALLFALQLCARVISLFLIRR